MGRSEHPLYWVYSGLILLLVPTIIMLIGLYEKALSPQAPIAPVPPPPNEVVLHSLSKFDPTSSTFRLKEVYQAVPVPRSGVLSAYKVLKGHETLAYRLVLVRHDIACATCRDLLVGILLAPGEDRVEAVLPLVPWELADGRFDPTPFFSQLIGRVLSDPLVVGRDIDGVTGATLSVNALVTQWSQAGHWLAESKGAAF